MTMDELVKISEALELGPDATVEDVLASIGALLQSVKGAGEGEDKGEDPSAEKPAGEATPAAPAAAAEDPSEDEDKAAAMAASARLMRLSGKASFGEAMREVETWRESHLSVEADRKKLADEREALEAGERRTGIVDLIKLGAETPATAWVDSKAKVLKPCKRLAMEPLDELKARAAALLAARGGKLPEAPKPPKGEEPEAGTKLVDGVTLSAKEVESVTKKAKQYGTDVDVALSRFAQNKSRQDQERGTARS